MSPVMLDLTVCIAAALHDRGYLEGLPELLDAVDGRGMRATATSPFGPLRRSRSSVPSASSIRCPRVGP